MSASGQEQARDVSERRATQDSPESQDSQDSQDSQESLRQSEERLRLLVESATEYAIFTLDTEGRVVSWNPGAQRIKGYSADEIIGRHFSVFYTDDERRGGHPAENLARALKNGSYAEEGWRVRKDGSPFWASVTLTALRDSRGRHTGFGKVTRDLTAKRKAEEDLRRLAQAEAERATADLLHSVTTAFAGALTSEAVARVVRENVLPALGLDGGSLAVTAGDELRMVWAEGYAPGTLAPYLAVSLSADLPHSRAAREQRAIILERGALADVYPQVAVALPLLLSLSLPLLARGRCIGVVGLTSTTRAELTPAERALTSAIADQCALALDRALSFEREAEAKRRASFMADATSLLARTLDASAIASSLAELAVPLLGDWCSLELLHGPARAVAHADPKKADIADALRRLVPPPEDERPLLRDVVRDGKPRLLDDVDDDTLRAFAWNEENLALLRRIGIRRMVLVPLIARGNAVGMLILAAAESDRRFSAEDIDLAAELCARAAYAVDNARLYREVESAVRVRDDFMSIAGHEIRTPLAALKLTLETIERASSRDPALQQNERLQVRVKKAVDSAARLERLVSELLDVSRIASGRLTLEPEKFDLATLVLDLAATLSEEAVHAGCELRVRAPDSLVGTWDKARVEQVVSNLLTNALKYGRGAPVDVELERDGDVAVIRVTDHGIGIAPEDQSRIFERFERAVSTKHYGGLGLGLWIARQVVESSGGAISVESALEKGARFTVRLPVAEVRG